MKLSDKLTEGAGIALNYIGGIASMWFGAVCTLFSLVFWGITGMSVPLAIFIGLFGLAPLGGGAWLFRRGRILRQLLRVKLQKNDVRRLAYQNQGRVTPGELAQHHNWSEERALNILKNLAAEDSDRIELQLDYESGEVYFEFPEIIQALEAKKQYQTVPISESVGRKAVEIAVMLEKTIDTFHDYVELTKETVSAHRKEKREERYRAQIKHFLDEIDELKQQ